MKDSRIKPLNIVNQLVDEWNIVLGLMASDIQKDGSYYCFHHMINWSKVSYRYSISLDPISSLVDMINPQMRERRKEMIAYLDKVESP